mgnify:CR=1 FL=1
MAFTRAEVSFLARHQAEIGEAENHVGLTSATMIADTDYLVKRFGDFGRSVSELLRARRVGARKGLPTHWIYPLEAAEQATPPAVVGERQRRIRTFFPDALVHDVTCSIGTEIATSASDEEETNRSPFRHTPVVGSDLDIARVACAQYNSGQPVFVADALATTTNARVIIADPARRSGGRRIPRPEDLLPPLPDLVAAHSGAELAFKCAPGIDYSDWDGLVSVTSVDSGVKEACLYTPGLAGGERREAIIIRDGVVADRLTSAEVAPAGDDDMVGEPGEFILDPDGAIVRAGLVRDFAAREGLWMLDPRIAHLTGNAIPAGYSGFRILDDVPLKKLKKALVPYHAGSAEILVRGVDISPDSLRKKLKLKGDTPVSIVITRIGKTAHAFICEPRQWG